MEGEGGVTTGGRERLGKDCRGGPAMAALCAAECSDDVSAVRGSAGQ